MPVLNIWNGSAWVEVPVGVDDHGDLAGLADVAADHPHDIDDAAHDTGATGAELDTLTDGSDASALHDHPTFYITLTVETPTASENFGIGFLFAACTVQEIQAVVVDDGGGSPSCTIEPVHHANRNTATGSDNDILDNPTAITNEAGGQNLTSFDDATIPADSWLWLRTTAVNNCAEIALTFRLTWD